MAVDLSTNHEVHIKCTDNDATTDVTNDGTNADIVTSVEYVANTAAMHNANGKITSCFNFSGQNNGRVKIFDNSGGSPYHTYLNSEHSICLWFKADDGHPTYDMGLFGADGITDWRANVESDGSLFFYFYQGSNIRLDTSSSVLDDGQEDWHWLCIICKGGASEMFLDNVSVATDNASYPSGTWQYSAYYLGDNISNWNWFSGLMCDFRVINKGLSSDERAFIWNGGAGTEAQAESGGSADNAIFMGSNF